jgi:U4/U6 small nuclear ribonucleoprotein PRP31
MSSFESERSLSRHARSQQGYSAIMEATPTLADALLDDLDDLSDGGDDLVEAEKGNEDYGVGEDALGDDAGLDIDRSRHMLDEPLHVSHIGIIRDIMASSAMHNNVSSSDNKKGQQNDHKLLVQSNQTLRAAAHDLATAHSALCQAYEPKFPELEELIPDATQYVKAVRSIGNETDLTVRSVNDALNTFLSNHQIITLSVAGSTTAGRLLTPEEFIQVDRIATYMEHVLEIEDLLTRYIEQQMEGTAPNMHALVGAPTAAKLLALTGGLAALSKIPACNLQVLGQVKHGRNGVVSSVASQQPHLGVLAQTELVTKCPRHLRPKAVKIVAAKLALAIRCDFVNLDTGRPRTPESGLAFRQQIEAKFAMWQEPDKAPVLKALPK